MAAADATGVSETASRVERKRKAARERIIQAAEQLMRSRPVEEVTISDITSAADVGHGTFYLHFSSKYEVLLPIVQAAASQWDDAIQAQLLGCDDPAEVVGASTRYMGRQVNADPLWRWLLQHSGMPIDTVRDAIGRFAARDFGRGLLSGRFQVPDLPVANHYLFGGFVAGLLSSFEAKDPDRAIDHMAELVLRTLGLSAEEAASIAHRPLTPLNGDGGIS